jgi:hypothetical protein
VRSGTIWRGLKLGREVDLALEPVDAHPRRHLRRRDLHDDRALEPHLLDEEDAAHPAPPSSRSMV